MPEDDEEEDETPRQAWNARAPKWHAKAKCKDLENPDEMFFGGGEQDQPVTKSKLREAKKYCADCPVFADCLNHALTEPERHGIWAGTSKRARMRILMMVSDGLVTIPQVVEDYLQGREKRYESIRHGGARTATPGFTSSDSDW